VLAEQLLELFKRLDLSRFQLGQFNSDHGRDGTDLNDVSGLLVEVDERSGDKDEEKASDMFSDGLLHIRDLCHCSSIRWRLSGEVEGLAGEEVQGGIGWRRKQRAGC
jgi:hypothetical protein